MRRPAPPWWQEALAAVVLGGAAVYAAACALLWLAGEALVMSPPAQGYVPTNPELRRLTLPTPTGPQRLVWRVLEAADGFPWLIYCPDTDDNLLTNGPRVEELYRQGFGVAVVEYPGYGASEGAPSAEGAALAARAVAEVLRREGVPQRRLIAYGQGLGGAVAAQLAADGLVGGLVLESTPVAAYRRFTRVKVLPWDVFDTTAALAQVTVPTLVIQGDSDPELPLWNGRALLAAAAGPRSFVWVAGSTSATLAQQGGPTLRAILDEFSRTLARP